MFGRPLLIDLLDFIISNETPEHIKDRIQVVVDLKHKKLEEYVTIGLCSCFEILQPIGDEEHFGCSVFCNDGNTIIKPSID